jgi:hypothetical protein
MALNEAFSKSRRAMEMTTNNEDVSANDNAPSNVDLNGNTCTSPPTSTPSPVIEEEEGDNFNENCNALNCDQYVETNSASTSNHDDENGNAINIESSIALDLIRASGIIKLDMSRIMDQTGLPTYEAALKLKSSNYI